MKETALYRHFSDIGELLYVGIAGDVQIRTSQHKKSKWFNQVRKIEIEYFETRSDALSMEEKIIKECHPIYNRVHSAINPVVFIRNKTMKQVQKEDCESILPALKNALNDKTPGAIGSESGVGAALIYGMLSGRKTSIAFDAARKLITYLAEYKDPKVEFAYVMQMLSKCNSSEVSKNTGITYSTIHAIKTGKRTSPSFSTVNRLAEYFKERNK